jgi:hypothetical protein
VAARGAPVINTVQQLFTATTVGLITILKAGPVGITDGIVSNGLPSLDANVIAGYADLTGAKETLIVETINYINNTAIGFVYDQTRCEKDLGYIIDSVAFDLLHGGNKQSVKSGVYYWAYNNASTAIPNEIPQTSAAYNFIKTLTRSIVLDQTPANYYQNTIPQVRGLTPGTNYEVISLQSKLDLITEIIRLGPDFAPDKVPINMTMNESVQVLNAYNLLKANREFIQAEVIAYIDSQLNNFDFSREKSY